jgi:superfamily I DNA/RNA helicase/mRNA-degrading endonuclease RelE of RelBE toxin-antitoxin system
MKEGFLSEWLALPPKEQAQVGSKIKILTGDPHPDGVTKKQLTHVNRHVHRLRSGDYRVFYTFDDRFVSLLKLVRRSEDTYDGGIDAEFFRGPEEEPSVTRPLSYSPAVAATAPSVATASRPFPTALDQELLNRLLIPRGHWSRLLTLKDEDALLACEGVPDDVLLRIHHAVFERPLSVALEEKELVANTVDDLFRYRDRDLLAFLLRLSAEQEKFVSWALESSGPTLVKGGPGTGKSTVALYRVRAMLESLKKAGVTSPRILFTTYTNALVTFSEQLLRGLLGDDAQAVDVRTADSIALSIVTSRSGPARIASPQDLRDAMTAALASTKQPGSSLMKRARVITLEKLGRDYLIEEINSVVEARRLTTYESYRDAKRPGRRVPLTEPVRAAVWNVKEAFDSELKRRGKMTFQQVRSYAAQLVEQGYGPAPYDAVVIDEAQDLDPSLLWLLTSLAKSPNRVFLTADADQSIYGSGFRWSDVHEGLKFKGRTGILRANFRSTREIGEAARAYLADGVLEDEAITPEYVHSGPLPIARHVASAADEAALLSRFFTDAARELRLPVWAGALLVPSEKAGERLAAQVSAAGVPARFMTGRELDLGAQAIKVITLKSAKGLEFPAVAIAGFEPPYPYVRAGTSEEERDERVAQERRTLFVGMTRAMHALLLSIPNGLESSLLAGLSEGFWNTDRPLH